MHTQSVECDFCTKMPFVLGETVPNCIQQIQIPCRRSRYTELFYYCYSITREHTKGCGKEEEEERLKVYASFRPPLVYRAKFHHWILWSTGTLLARTPQARVGHIMCLVFLTDPTKQGWDRRGISNTIRASTQHSTVVWTVLAILNSNKITSKEKVLWKVTIENCLVGLSPPFLLDSANDKRTALFLWLHLVSSSTILKPDQTFRNGEIPKLHWCLKNWLFSPGMYSYFLLPKSICWIHLLQIFPSLNSFPVMCQLRSCLHYAKTQYYFL